MLRHWHGATLPCGDILQAAEVEPGFVNVASRVVMACRAASSGGGRSTHAACGLAMLEKPWRRGDGRAWWFSCGVTCSGARHQETGRAAVLATGRLTDHMLTPGGGRSGKTRHAGSRRPRIYPDLCCHRSCMGWRNARMDRSASRRLRRGWVHPGRICDIMAALEAAGSALVPVDCLPR